jgi:hypothetical protein
MMARMDSQLQKMEATVEFFKEKFKNGHHGFGS